MEERGHPQTNDLERHQSARPRQPRQMRRREAGRQEFMDSNTGEESAGRQLCSGGGAEGGGGGGGGGCERGGHGVVDSRYFHAIVLLQESNMYSVRGERRGVELWRRWLLSSLSVLWQGRRIL